MNPWPILQIEPTQDRIQIKKAYAARLKQTRPDDNAADFQQLYQAYQAALAACTDENARAIATVGTSEQGINNYAYCAEDTVEDLRAHEISQNVWEQFSEQAKEVFTQSDWHQVDAWVFLTTHPVLINFTLKEMASEYLFETIADYQLAHPEIELQPEALISLNQIFTWNQRVLEFKKYFPSEQIEAVFSKLDLLENQTYHGFGRRWRLDQLTTSYLRRLCAFLIDVAVSAGLTISSGLAWWLAMELTIGTKDTYTGSVIEFLWAGAGITAFIYTAMTIGGLKSARRATLGMRAMKLCLLSEDDDPDGVLIDAVLTKLLVGAQIVLFPVALWYSYRLQSLLQGKLLLHNYFLDTFVARSDDLE